MEIYWDIFFVVILYGLNFIVLFILNTESYAIFLTMWMHLTWYEK